MGMLIITFLVGVPFNVVVVTLPQRFQVVSGTTAFGAGLRLLPYSFSASFGAFVANIAGAKGKIAPIDVLFVGALFQVLGLALLSTLTTSASFPAAGYGYEVLAGMGIGLTFGILVLATPFIAEPRDLAVATGAIIQFRFLGGAIGLAIASSVLNSYIKSHSENILSPGDLAALLQSTDVLVTFAPDVRASLQDVFAQGYNLQYKIIAGIAAAQFPAAVLMWRKGGQILAAV
ncbi:hypothetical protein MMC17_003834 [Xylographa soralifera]|nr:hypothetical protein [Xylographa soralifera]